MSLVCSLFNLPALFIVFLLCHNKCSHSTTIRRNDATRRTCMCAQTKWPFQPISPSGWAKERPVKRPNWKTRDGARLGNWPANEQISRNAPNLVELSSIKGYEKPVQTCKLPQRTTVSGGRTLTHCRRRLGEKREKTSQLKGKADVPANKLPTWDCNCKGRESWTPGRVT